MSEPARVFSYWEKQAGVVFETTSADLLPSKVDILIVGAGFMGLWLAYFLLKAQPSLKLLVVERDAFAYGASSRNAGFLTSGHVSELLADAREAAFDDVVDNCLARRAGVDIVLEEFGRKLDVLACGSADFDPIDDAKREFVGKLNAAFVERGSSMRFETRRLSYAGQEREAFFNAADGGVQPVRLLELLARFVREQGGSIVHQCEATSLGDGRAQLRMADGELQDIGYEHSYVCTNAFANELVELSSVIPGRGQVIVTTPVSMKTQACLGYLNDGYDYFRPLDGRLLIGGGRHLFRRDEQTKDIETTPSVIDYLKEQARQIIGHDDWQIESQWAGIMGFSSGTHMACLAPKEIDARTYELAGFGGMGVALTPWLAKRIGTLGNDGVLLDVGGDVSD